MKTEKITYSLNRQLELTACEGHFAGRHSHTNYYLDITQIKHRHTQARLAAIELAQRYILMRNVDTIVCLDGSEVIGAFLARHLAQKELLSLNSGKGIAVITPETNTAGQLVFRDNLVPMVKDQDVLVLSSTVKSGRTLQATLDCISYYGGRVQAVAAIFSAQEALGATPILSLFTPADLPDYMTAPPACCPLCAAGRKLDGLANSYGISRLP